MLRDAVRANNEMAAEIKARDDREERLRREAAIRDQVEHYSHELSTTTAKLGDMTKKMAAASEEMIVQERRAREDTDFARTASLQAAADVASVATASEQLLEAIGEISRQAVEIDRRWCGRRCRRPMAPAPRCCASRPPPIASATW